MKTTRCALLIEQRSENLKHEKITAQATIQLYELVRGIRKSSCTKYAEPLIVVGLHLRHAMDFL